MNHFKAFKNLLKRSLLILIILFEIVFSVHSQPRGDYWGDQIPTQGLRKGPGRGSGSGGGPSGASAGGVGGVMFYNYAILDSTLKIQNLTIDYDNSQIDGSRLKLNINDKQVGYKIYDWQLIPLTKYADSPYSACFTYFGELIDKDLENLIRDNDGHILNYHPKLFNTLLGWRLADMDLLFLYEFTTDLPKVNNNYVLGMGETVSDINSNYLGLYNYSDYLTTVETDLGQSFRSYIITDYTRDIVVSLKNDSIQIEGYPYYYSWRYRYDTPGYNEQNIADSIQNHYMKILEDKLAENPDFYERGLYVDSLISLSLKYSDDYIFYAEGATFLDLVELDDYTKKTNFLERYTTGSLKDMLYATSKYMVSNKVIHLKELSERMSQHPKMLEAINPEVWNATVITMRVSAFFRYLKENFPTQWQAFVNQISDINPEPEVKTPTVLYKTGNTIIEDAIIAYKQSNSAENEITQALIRIFPNPVMDRLFIQNLQNENQIVIVSPDGKICISENVADVQCEIPVQELSSGIYLVQIIQNNRVVFRQTIVKSN